MRLGPIVRITPYEVHIDDPAYFNELFNVTKKLDKDPWYYSWLGRNGSVFATTDSDLHKIRSPVIKRAFSTASIARVESVLLSHFNTMCRRLQERKESKTPLPLAEVFRSLAVDVITDMSLPESHHLLEVPDYGASHSDFIRGITEVCLWNRHLVGLLDVLQGMPRWLVALHSQTAVNIVDSVEGQKEQARRVIKNNGKPISAKTYPVIMNEVYKSPDLPPQEKTERRLFEEIAILIGAGSETTGHSLSMITYFVTANPEILERLQDELRSNFSAEQIQNVLSYKQLEHLPYLNACISEGLRLANGVCGRLPRINRVKPTTYIASGNSETYLIPAGTPISMSLRDMHFNHTFFPSPNSFDPERFLGERKAQSEKWAAPFSRGSRSCVGRNLAMAELLMAIGNLFARFDVSLAEGTTREDVDIKFDCFSPFPKRETNGLLVYVS